jgi:hypothetical protein
VHGESEREHREHERDPRDRRAATHRSGPVAERCAECEETERERERISAGLGSVVHEQVGSPEQDRGDECASLRRRVSAMRPAVAEPRHPRAQTHDGGPRQPVRHPVEPVDPERSECIEEEGVQDVIVFVAGREYSKQGVDISEELERPDLIEPEVVPDRRKAHEPGEGDDGGDRGNRRSGER